MLPTVALILNLDVFGMVMGMIIESPLVQPKVDPVALVWHIVLFGLFLWLRLQISHFPWQVE